MADPIDLVSHTKELAGRHNFDSVDAFRGKLSRKNIENPADIERVQFMKLYAGIE